MSDEGLGAFVAIVLFAALFMLCGFGIGYNNGHDNGECTERWRHQVTAADTLSTIRTGSAQPGETKE